MQINSKYIQMFWILLIASQHFNFQKLFTSEEMWPSIDNKAKHSNPKGKYNKNTAAMMSECRRIQTTHRENCHLKQEAVGI